MERIEEASEIKFYDTPSQKVNLGIVANSAVTGARNLEEISPGPSPDIVPLIEPDQPRPSQNDMLLQFVM